MNEELMKDWKKVFEPSNEVFLFRVLWMMTLAAFLFGVYSDARSIKGSFFPPAFSKVQGQIISK